MTQEEPRTTGEGLKALFLYIIFMAVLMSPVIFGGKSLVPCLFQPHGLVAEGVYHRQGRLPANIFNVDIATPAYYEFPVDRTIGNIYRAGGIPLWNPYQAAGTPLAAQYSTRAFFPYQVLQDISPFYLWDFFILGRILIAGFLTYLFIRNIGAGFWPSFAGGLFYMFSGLFTWFVNLEQLANPAMTLPLVMYAMERMAGRRHAEKTGRNTAIAAVSFGLMLLAGQPETALYLISFTLLYFLVRTVSIQGPKALVKELPPLFLAGLLGLAIASPLLIPFAELAGHSFHIHPLGGKLGTEFLRNWKTIFGIINPTATEFPTNPEMILGLSMLGEVRGTLYRFFPINGIWDTLGGYTGVTVIIAAFSGLFVGLVKKSFPFKKEALFFILIGSALILKNLGVPPFVYLGKVPVFDMVWSLRWASPVWIFSFAAGAALGLEALKHEREEGEKEAVNRNVLVAAPFVLLMGVFLIYSFIPSVFIVLKREEVYNAVMAPYAVASLLYGSIVTIGAGVAAFLIIVLGRGRRLPVAVLLLAALELWWDIPFGYSADWKLYRWIPLGAGAAALYLFLTKRKLYSALALVLFILLSFAVDSLSPKGLPARQDPFKPTPYVKFLKEKTATGHWRATGAYGVLFPNFAGAVGIVDIRYVNSLLPETFYNFRRKHLHLDVIDEFSGFVLWFTGRPERGFYFEKYGKTLGDLIKRAVEEDYIARLRNYSLLGVKYFLFPSAPGFGLDPDGPSFRAFRERFPLVYSGEVEIYENLEAVRRVFVAGDFSLAEGYDEAQRLLAEGDFDPERKVILEKEPAGLAATEEPAAYSAAIKEYNAGSVTVEAETDRPGILVLTDIYYPGWRARVNGRAAEILRVDGLFRGVVIEKGKNTVEFFYRPPGFVIGIILAAAALLVSGFLAYRDYRYSYFINRL